MARTPDSHFPTRSRLGAFVLLVLLISAITFWRVFPSWLPAGEDRQSQELQRSWAGYERQYTEREKEAEPRHSGYSPQKENEPAKTAVALFYFDPNTATEQELLSLGLPPRTVRSWLKYRSYSPQAFKTTADLKKLYTLSAEDYARIAPYVRIPGTATAAVAPVNNIPVSEKQKAPMTVELNAASAEQLMALKGIGPVLSNRIIHFRDALGGFYQVSQLREVYGLPDSTYTQLEHQFTVNITLVKQININIAEEAVLARQTYIGKRLAGAIVRLRQQLQSFKQLEDLKQIPLINEEKYRKIAPYLSTH